MSLTGQHLEQLSQLVDAAATVVIALPNGAQMDELSASLAWAALLEKMGKEVRLIAATPSSLSENHVPGMEKITTQLGKQNLVVSFEYSPEQVDKVSYHIGEETNRFYLTIRPKQGFDPLTKDSLELTYAGAQADLVIYVGVNDLDDLSPLSDEYDEFFRDTPSVVLSHNETAFGTVKCVTNSAAGLCEESAQLFVQLGWELEEPVATLLLRGIEAATSGLTALSTTPDTFETVALLLRAGARRSRRADPSPAVKANQEHVAPVEKTAQRIDRPSNQPSEQPSQSNSQPQPTRTQPPRTIDDVLNRGKDSAEPLSHQAVAQTTPHFPETPRQKQPANTLEAADQKKKKRHHYQGRKH